MNQIISQSFRSIAFRTLQQNSMQVMTHDPFIVHRYEYTYVRSKTLLHKLIVSLTRGQQIESRCYGTIKGLRDFGIWINYKLYKKGHKSHNATSS